MENRIHRFSDSVNPSDLEENPLNWRLHPLAQEKVVRWLLENIGWVRPLIRNRGTGRLIDGHLRRQIALDLGEEGVPVEDVDLTEDEERLVLAAFDTITKMAGTGAESVEELARRVGETGDQMVDVLIESLTLSDTGDLLLAMDDDSFEPLDREDPTIAKVRVGQYRVDVPIGTFAAWRKEVAEEIGSDVEDALAAEVMDRLGFYREDS